MIEQKIGKPVSLELGKSYFPREADFSRGLIKTKDIVHINTNFLAKIPNCRYYSMNQGSESQILA